LLGAGDVVNFSVAPVSRRVLSIIHDPVLGGRRLHQLFGWNVPDLLAGSYVWDVRDCSFAYANFEIVERVEVDGFPVKQDGFRYTIDNYLKCWRSRSGFHQPDLVDYYRLLDEFDIIPKINSGAIDEVWLFGFPYAGYYESIMAGPGAFWCNAPPLTGTKANRRFVIMGFNYERGVGEMLEDLGHRAESIMSRVFAGKRGEANLWERFTRYDKTHPGKAECGNVHFAPNSERDYDWGNRREVVSKCDDWYSFPNFKGATRRVNCSEWGDGDIRLHHLWWFKHFPHVAGETDGIAHNWWSYIIDPNLVI
jgi:hypothetical protein